MATTRYTSTSSLPITFTWKCSACGKINTKSRKIVTEGAETLIGGTRNSQEARDTASAIASERMNMSLMMLTGDISSIHYGMYRNLKFNNACQRCHHKEIWATESIFEKYYTIVITIAGILFLLSMLLGAASETTLAIVAGLSSLISFILFVALYFYDINYFRDWKDRKMKENTPLASYPVLVINGEPIANKELLQDDNPIQVKPKTEYHEIKKLDKELIPDREPNKTPNDISDETQTSQKQSFCRRCGKELPDDSLFCPYCGTKTVLYLSMLEDIK